MTEMKPADATLVRTAAWAVIALVVGVVVWFGNDLYQDQRRAQQAEQDAFNRKLCAQGLLKDGC